MRPKKSNRLRGSVTQNNVSVRIDADERTGVGFLARLGLLGIAIITCALLLGWLWHSGWIQRQGKEAQETAMELTQKAHFSIKDVVVEGRRQSNKDDVFDALGTERGAPILAFDAKAAVARLAKLPWINSAVIERRLPDTVAVILTERVPLARWQHDEKLYVVDSDGHVLPGAKANDFAALPLVVGTGAEREAQNFLPLLQSYPDFNQKVDSIVRVGDRRWDLHLTPKIIVRLPEENVANALHRLSVLITQEKIFDRDIASIDLRLPDRLTIEPATPAAKTGDVHP